MDATTQDLRGLSPATSFRHEALLYAGADEFVAGTASFVRDALAAGEPVMIAVVEPRAGMLRAELGTDGLDTRDVRFIDVESLGRNPARIIPAWQAWSDEQRLAGRTFRGIGEPVWAGRSPAEIVECRQHEALLNTVFDDGPGWWLLCPYDTASLDPDVVESASHTHPSILEGEKRTPSPAYPAPDLSWAAMLADPLPEPAGPIDFETRYTSADLHRLRVAVGTRAQAAGLGRARATDLVIAVNELVTNSILHGGGEGRLRIWLEAGHLVAEAHDRGRITDPLIGRRRPTGSPNGGAGVWMTNQLCDLVQIRSSADTGTTVRVRVSRW